jgi:hypothetical protein
MTRPHRLFPLLVLVLGLGAPGCGPGSSTAPTGGEPPAEPPKANFKDGKTLDAGDVDYAKPHDYTFTVANDGGTPLALKLVKKGCSCTGVKMPDGPIAPGTEGKVVVHWAPIPGNSGPYNVTADLETNDPKDKSPQLLVKAWIKPLVRVFIDGQENRSFVDFGDDPIPPDGARVRELTVFSTELPAFHLDATSAQPGLEVKTTPLEAGKRLGSYEARSGYTVEVRSTDKLPLGYVRADLNLALSKLGTDPDRTITVPVYALVGSGSFTASPTKLLFKKPHITEEDTAKVNLTFINPPAEMSVKVKSYEPKFLQVDAPEKLAPGNWRITAHLPKNNPEAAPFQADPDGMEGQVVLEVSSLEHPVTIRVRWDPHAK